jgi:hypothetical protein
MDGLVTAAASAPDWKIKDSARKATHARRPADYLYLALAFFTNSLV